LVFSQSFLFSRCWYFVDLYYSFDDTGDSAQNPLTPLVTATADAVAEELEKNPQRYN
jgi:hypothetical protein